MVKSLSELMEYRLTVETESVLSYGRVVFATNGENGIFVESFVTHCHLEMKHPLNVELIFVGR